ncbi:bifunctional phosphopantothenoylcysteine decarboxylase/phosphopantothenate--cysteine ligase CoaBC [Candidatus Dependentiae bacterium]|nr:bifunctional phosphopantothenoylcysteine decarboxylase/phosphopantothenate--cysteine ligase CoaBC [Candidatus Dependentiae bacterium]
MLSNKNVLIGISGGIAAYKIPQLIRILKKNDNNIKTVMTKNSFEFVTKVTIETLSQNSVYSDMFEYSFDISHISLCDWADFMIIAPATANIIGKLANGIADDLLTTVFSAFDKNIFICPAMNDKMFSNAIVQTNLEKLNGLNNIKIIEPESGMLACGCEGKGRMAEPENIYKTVSDFYKKKSSLKNKTVLITAGPTKEYIDPVRFISNDSSGFQGYFIANECVNRGASVILITGPTGNAGILNREVKVITVISAEEMFEKVKENFDISDIFISAAAVSDYKTEKYSDSKIKKNKGEKFLKLELIQNPDILKYCGENKGNRIIVGFAAETDDLMKNALKKFQDKKCDMLVANEVKNSLGKLTNRIQIIKNNGEVISTCEQSKKNTASVIIDNIELLINEKK